MLRRSLISTVLAGIALLVWSLSASAGGWATVTPDAALPSELQVGQTLQLGFMVKQHGVTPIHFGFPDKNSEVKPYLTATKEGTKDSFRVEATRIEPVGHFRADLKFPSEGAWQIEFVPYPFPALTALPDDMKGKFSGFWTFKVAPVAPGAAKPPTISLVSDTAALKEAANPPAATSVSQSTSANTSQAASGQPTAASVAPAQPKAAPATSQPGAVEIISGWWLLGLVALVAGGGGLALVLWRGASRRGPRAVA